MIETSHLSKLYKRGVYALRDLSLTIDKGEFIFLTGPSGAGKSTFLRLLLREELPSEGDLKVLGRDLRTLRALGLLKMVLGSRSQKPRSTLGYIL